jgi:rod shape-determining protein MreC
MYQRHKSKYGNIVFTLLILAGFSLIIGRHTSSVKLIKNLVYYISYPSLNLANNIFSSAENFAGNIKDMVYAHQENIAYRLENQKLADKLRNYEAVSEEYDGLLRLLDLARIKNTVSVFARVSVRDPSEWYQWFIIDKGAADGLRSGFPVAVVSRGKGVLCAVGKIAETHSSSSKVILITNAFYAFPVEIKDKGISCLAEGFNSNLLKITYIPRAADVKPGDEVVVSELSAVFPKGMPVGVVTEVTEDSAADFKTAAAEVFFETGAIYKAVVLLPQAEK